MATVEESSTRRRPRDRGERIISAAADLFYESGYHHVTMSDVAGAVGITSSALYRHVPSKQEMLYRAIASAVEQFTAVVHSGSPRDLQSMIGNLVSAALGSRSLGRLWQQEGRHLTAEQRATLRAQLRQVTDGVARVIRSERPALAPGDADFLASCTLSVLASPSFHGVRLPRQRFEALLHGACEATLHVGLRSREGREVVARQPARTTLQRDRVLRGEYLLTLAAQRMARHGYAAVTLDDIAAEAGVTGPSLYTYFESKDQLLATAVSRGSHWLHGELSQILGESTAAEAALRRLLSSYANFCFKFPDVVQLLISEVALLPERERREALRAQGGYVAEWVALARALRPGLDQESARCLVHASLAVANDAGRIRRFRGREALAADVVAVGEAVLRSSIGIDAET